MILMRRSTVFLALGIIILVIGALLITVRFMSIPQTRKWTVNYSFPRGSLATHEEHYSIGGAHSTFCSYRDEICVVDYDAPYDDHEIREDQVWINLDLYNRSKEAKLLVIFTDKYNYTLGVHSLVDPLPPSLAFVSPRHGEIKIYLGSPLSLEELQEKGCYGNWNLTFRLYHYPNLSDIPLHPHYALIFGFFLILAGISVITVSLRRIERED